MANNEKTKLPEPSWKEQLYAYGFTDEDIDDANEVPLHRFLIRMNLTFSTALRTEIKTILDSQTTKIYKELAESFIIRDEKFDRKFDMIMNAIDKQTKSVNSLTKKVNELQKVQKDHGTRITQLEGTLSIIFQQHKMNHPKPER